MTNALEEREVVRLKKQPPNIENGTMREYQVEGLNWMIHLHDCGLNGILADEMGLGKTLQVRCAWPAASCVRSNRFLCGCSMCCLSQTISLLAYLKSARGNNGPHLVVVPMTTLGNWMREFKRWCPTMKCLKLHASKKERGELAREVMLKGDHNVICTTYEVVKLERASLRKMPFEYVEAPWRFVGAQGLPVLCTGAAATLSSTRRTGLRMSTRRCRWNCANCSPSTGCC